MSARNIQRTQVTLARNLNTYDILNAKKIFILESSLPQIEEILG
jgi:ribosomal protein L4